MDIEKEYSDFRKAWMSPEDSIEAMTSGSTGAPSCVRLLKSDMRISAEATCRRFGITDGSRLVVPLRATYIAGKMMAVRSYVSGAELIPLSPSRDPLAGYHGGGIDLLAIVPSQVEGLLANPARELVRNVIVGGAPMTAKQELLLAEAGIDAFATYGMTETCSHVALRRVTEDYFEAMPGFTFSTDASGCLIINSERMSFRSLLTRDIVQVISPKKFRWIGRADNCINSGGVKLYPEEIEARLGNVMDGITFYITSRPSEQWGSEAVMVIVGENVPDEALKQRIEAALPRYWRPKAYVTDASPEYTSSGKLIRRRFT